MRTPAAQAAALIRKELKKHGVKASVKSENYSMGSSVRVTMEDELPAIVAKIKVFAAKFQYGHFDGMNDIYEYSNDNPDLPQAKHVFVQCHYSKQYEQEAWEMVRSSLHGMDAFDADYRNVNNHDATQHVFRVLNGSDDFVGFWATKKPRIAA